jgi:hypothetical protein
MNKLFRILLLTTVFVGVLYTSFANRGVGRKKKKVVLNIKAPVSFVKSLNFNLNNGMRFSGSFLRPLSTVAPIVPATFSFNTLVTYQKGNCVYIVPYKQKILVADVQQGYTGTKLIIKMK